MSDNMIEMLIKRGEESKVIKMIKRLGGEALRYTTQNGTPLLNMAILHHNHGVAKLLLEMSADPCHTDTDGRTALHVAAEVDDFTILIDLLMKCSINQQDANGDTALHIAVRKTSVNVIKWLVFEGADPEIKNKENKFCRFLTGKNYIHQILRDTHRPPMRSAMLTPSEPYVAEGLPFSMELPRGSSASTEFVYYWTSFHQLSSVKRRSLKEDEQPWGPVVEYRVVEPVDVDMTFPLHYIPDRCYELVLRLINDDEDCARDVLLDAIDATPPNAPDVPEDDVVYAAFAKARVTLDYGGMLMVLLRPVQQPVWLKGGETTMKSKVDDRVQLSLTDFTDGDGFRGKLQLEPSLPVFPPVAVAEVPKPVKLEYESQTAYVKVSAEDTTDSTAAGQMLIDFPYPEEYAGGQLEFYSRINSVDSDVSTDNESTHHKEMSARRSFVHRASQTSSNPDDTQSSDGEDEREACKWVKEDSRCLRKTSDSIRVPVKTNRTITVVEPNQKCSEDKRRKTVARNYRKRRNKKALLFVAGRPDEPIITRVLKKAAGRTESLEVVVVVTSPTYLSRELGRHMQDGYCLINVSGEFCVPNATQFKVTVIGELAVPSGQNEAVLTFRSVLRLSQTDNFYKVALKRKDGVPTLGKFRIDKKERKKSDTWRYEGELHFNLDSLVNANTSESPFKQDFSDPARHFTECLLMDLAGRLLPSEAPVFAIRLGLSASQVDNVIKDPDLHSPMYKCYELLRRRRDGCDSDVHFGQSLVRALRSMEWNQQCEWPLQQLSDWPKVTQIHQPEEP